MKYREIRGLGRGGGGVSYWSGDAIINAASTSTASSSAVEGDGASVVMGLVDFSLVALGIFWMTVVAAVVVAADTVASVDWERVVQPQ